MRLVSFVPGKWCEIYVDKRSRKTSTLQRGHLVSLTEVRRRLVGGMGDNRPVNPMHFRGGTSVFLDEAEERLVGLDVEISPPPANPLHFREGIAFFCESKNYWWGPGHA